jgi:hypothetical protein
MYYVNSKNSMCFSNCALNTQIYQISSKLLSKGSRSGKSLICAKTHSLVQTVNEYDLINIIILPLRHINRSQFQFPVEK